MRWQSQLSQTRLTFEAASCRVRPEIGKGVLFDIRDWISRLVSVSRETLKTTLMLVLSTVVSLAVSGTDEAKVHSSSSFAALMLLCARFEGGAVISPPSKSTAAEPVVCALIDCWYWKGEPCRGVEVKAAKGSGERGGWAETFGLVDEGGDTI